MAIALAAYNFIIKYKAGKTNPVNIPLRQPLSIGGPLKKKYHTTINLKDFRNIRLLI